MILYALLITVLLLVALLIHVINLYRRELHAHERTQAHLADLVASYSEECEKLRKAADRR